MRAEQGIKDLVSGVISIVVIIAAIVALLWANLSGHENALTQKKRSFIESLPQYPVEESLRDSYIKEISNKINNKYFLSDEEIKYFKESGYETTSAGKITPSNNLKNQSSGIQGYYPIMFNNSGKIIVCYATEDGIIVCNGLTGQRVNFLKDKEETLMLSPTELITYNYDEGKVEYWFLGKIKKIYKVPKKSIYSGHSFTEGYIFRSGTDVYALYHNEFFDRKEGIVKIAENVKEVITCNYCYNPEQYFEQPVFKMTDGDIRVYIGEKNKIDSENFVLQKVDGGQKKPYMPYE